MRALLAFVAVAIAGVGLYALPSLLELALVQRHLNPWVSCVVLGDMLGCGVLFVLGFRRMALGIYVLSSGFEAGLLMLRVVSPERLVWVSNLAPAIALGVILVQAALRNLVLEEN